MARKPWNPGYRLRRAVVRDIEVRWSLPVYLFVLPYVDSQPRASSVKKKKSFFSVTGRGLNTLPIRNYLALDSCAFQTTTIGYSKYFQAVPHMPNTILYQP